MRTIAPLFILLALGTSALMLQLAGFGAAWGAEPPQTDLAEKKVGEISEETNPNKGPIEGPVSGGVGGMLGLIVAALQLAMSSASAVIALPTTLMQIGFPAWFAQPLGRIAQIVAGIGAIEFGLNREWT